MDYYADLKRKMDSPDWDIAWRAYAEAYEWFDGEREVEEYHKRKFRAEWEAKRTGR